MVHTPLADIFRHKTAASFFTLVLKKSAAVLNGCGAFLYKNVQGAASFAAPCLLFQIIFLLRPNGKRWVQAPPISPAERLPLFPPPCSPRGWHGKKLRAGYV